MLDAAPFQVPPQAAEQSPVARPVRLGPRCPPTMAPLVVLRWHYMSVRAGSARQSVVQMQSGQLERIERQKIEEAAAVPAAVQQVSK